MKRGAEERACFQVTHKAVQHSEALGPARVREVVGLLGKRETVLYNCIIAQADGNK